ncbi:hypothetical protein GCM10009555_047520 [Acrocarpospora macrocephala]|uniref:Uncharacterized protein n=1 Tax=Acrocarpospora macrocephala TaxID=150177 RepID=A0A5M3WT82_9ACTN|nr:hypothetical protein [Acrocarpospora macrocephala]GES12094.1 hypothetical protein Amac_056910 [Acrocarpospora macrocephala]
MVDLGFVGFSKPANDYQLLDITDGDTPNIAMAIRMVSIDTPESEYGGSPATAQAALERAKTRCWTAPTTPSLRICAPT